AVDGAARYLRSLGGAVVERAPALELLAEAHGQADHPDEAMNAARELSAIADRVGTEPLLGAARHAEGCAHPASGSSGHAREAFEDAVGLFASAGLPLEAGRARLALACSLRALGRKETALAEFDRAIEAFRDLRAAAEEQRALQLRDGRQPKG